MLISHIRQIIDEILPNRALKQPCILQNHAEQLMHVLTSDILRGHAVNLNAAVGNFIESHKKVYHGGLTGAGRADDRNLLTRCDMG